MCSTGSQRFIFYSGNSDSDSDGVVDAKDLDDDNDGILDVHDDDDDGDSIPDKDEDYDSDGAANAGGTFNIFHHWFILSTSEDKDDDGDGVLDGDEDDDSDGLQNDEDPDDDGDGIPDENDELISSMLRKFSLLFWMSICGIKNTSRTRWQGKHPNEGKAVDHLS